MFNYDLNIFNETAHTHIHYNFKNQKNVIVTSERIQDTNNGS
jgi:hypothetical protein